MAGTAKEKLFELISDMNGSSEDEVSSTIGMEYGGGLDDAYMTLSERKRRSSAFADPNANSAFASPMSQGGLPTVYRFWGGDVYSNEQLSEAEGISVDERGGFDAFQEPVTNQRGLWEPDSPEKINRQLAEKEREEKANKAAINQLYHMQLYGRVGQKQDDRGLRTGPTAPINDRSYNFDFTPSFPAASNPPSTPIEDSSPKIDENLLDVKLRDLSRPDFNRLWKSLSGRMTGVQSNKFDRHGPNLDNTAREAIAAANKILDGPMSTRKTGGGLPTIYRQDGGDYDYDYSLEDIGLNTGDFVGSDYDFYGDYNVDYKDMGYTPAEASYMSGDTVNLGGPSFNPYPPKQTISPNNPYMHPDGTPKTGPGSDRSVHSPDWTEDESMLSNLNLLESGPTVINKDEDKDADDYEDPTSILSVVNRNVPAPIDSDPNKEALAALVSQKSSEEEIDYTDPKHWRGYNRTSSPESMPNVDIGVGVTPIVADAGVNIGIGKQFGSSGEDRPIDTIDPDDFITNPEARYEALYGSKKGDPTFTEGGQFIYNRLGEPDLGPNLDPEAIRARLNKEGYTRTEYVYLNDLLSKGYSMKQAEDILVQGMATPGGLSAMQSGFKDGYSYGGPAGTLLDAIEKGTQHTLGIGQVLQEKKKRREEDKEFAKYRAGFIGEEIPKDKAEEVVGSNFLNFVGDLLGLKRGEANILDKDSISQISAKAEEQGFTYKTPNSFANMISSFLPSKAAIPFTILQNILPNKSVGTITSKKDGTTFSLNEDGSLTFVEDPASLNYDEGSDAAPARKSRPVKQQVSTSTEEPPKTGMAALLARRPDPKKRLNTLADLQEKYRKIYGRPFETGIG